MRLERVRRQDVAVPSQFVDMDRWIEEADHDHIERLLAGALEITSPDDQLFLQEIWADCEDLNNGYADRDIDATYYWTRRDSEQLRREIAIVRPGYLDADPRQESLF